jgi:hypothetical protein
MPMDEVGRARRDVFYVTAARAAVEALDQNRSCVGYARSTGHDDDGRVLAVGAVLVFEGPAGMELVGQVLEAMRAAGIRAELRNAPEREFDISQVGGES